MKQLIFLTLFSLIAINAVAQKTKRFDIFSNQTTRLYGRVSYEGDVQKDTVYVILGRDARYQQIVEYIILREGSLKEIYDFFIYCNAFVKKEDDGVSETYEGNNIGVHKVLGMKYLSMNGIEGDDRGWTSFAIPDLTRVVAGIEYFAKKHQKIIN